MIPHNQHVLMYLCKIIIMFSRTNKHIDLKHIEEPLRTLKTHAAFKVLFFPKPNKQRGIAADLLYISRLTRLKHARIWLLKMTSNAFVHEDTLFELSILKISVKERIWKD